MIIIYFTKFKEIFTVGIRLSILNKSIYNIFLILMGLLDKLTWHHIMICVVIYFGSLYHKSYYKLP